MTSNVQEVWAQHTLEGDKSESQVKQEQEESEEQQRNQYEKKFLHSILLKIYPTAKFMSGQYVVYK